MSVNELLQNVQFVVDTVGNKTAVMLDYKDWEELITLLEDIEDAEELGRSPEDELIPWEQAQVELRAKGINV